MPYCCYEAEVGRHKYFLSLQLQFRNLKEALSAIAIPQLFKKCCSATATPQFRNQIFLKSTTSNLKLEGFTSAMFGIFLAWNPVDSLKKKSHATVPLRQVFVFERNRQFQKYFWLIFKNHTEKMMEKRLKFARSYQTGPR
jgi:hypothetical protein